MSYFYDERDRARCTDCTSQDGYPKLIFVTFDDADGAAHAAESRGVYLDVYQGPCGYWHLARAAEPVADDPGCGRVLGWIVVGTGIALAGLWSNCNGAPS